MRLGSSILVAFLQALVYQSSVEAFSAVLSPPSSSPLTVGPNVATSADGIVVGIPNLDKLFATICQVSPAANKLITGATTDEDLPWKTVQKYDPNRTVQQIEKIDNFQGHNAPLIRLRSTLQGPCLPDSFAGLIMDLEERKRWDTQIDNVDQIITLPHEQFALAPGMCRCLGVGHCLTKSGLGISPREQLTLCGIQDIEIIDSDDDASPTTAYMIWGTELGPDQNHLLPVTAQRCTRATSHVFAVTLIPRDAGSSFDVEYILQLEIGGNLPPWLTTPIMIDSIRSMFKVADDLFSGADGRLLFQLLENDAAALKNEQHSMLPDGLLMSTP